MIRPLSMLLIATIIWAQPLKSPEEIFNLVRENLSLIQDYQVDMKIKVAMPGFRMPGKKVSYAFKVPDKVKLETTGFAVVPRQGILPFYNELMNDSLQINVETLERTTIDGENVWVVAFQDSLYRQDALIKLWVTDPHGTILKGVATIGGKDVLTLTSQYAHVEGIAWMPVETEMEIMLPGQMKTLQHFNSTPQAKMDVMNSLRDTTETPVSGSIHLEFSKYKLNRGLPDSFFQED
ncbi:MAG: hypothetical protein K9N34_01195 [Candidatus Marinimicrobia bacterium]|nr:hypothetical protein [Candidatus Neomarinimicrobiota bacterium]MCF7839250.1 hypothetical protein [Candidatus Neomarinimicrobiota bacterium]MCF7902218.1 hypothetical protein [Candidatus Neomarinimicrobiota bacterium]